jgi:hypothetical protein
MKTNAYQLLPEDTSLLREDERRLHALLQQADPRTPWGRGISDVLKEGSPAAFRQLVEQLRSQAADGPRVMKGLIGEEALGVLMGIGKDLTAGAATVRFV